MILLVLYWLGIFVATHLPPGTTRPVHVSDKIQHLGAYLGLTILLEVALARKLRAPHAWVTILIVLSYGAIDEALQPLVGRTADIMDWVADAAGAAIGVCLCGAARFAFSAIARRPVPAAELEQSRV